jgi:hypothetical protein
VNTVVSLPDAALIVVKIDVVKTVAWHYPFKPWNCPRFAWYHVSVGPVGIMSEPTLVLRAAAF